MAASKKPSLASVAADSSVGSASGSNESDEEDEGYSTAFGELADVLSVPEEKMGAFKEAMEAVVASCMAKG